MTVSTGYLRTIRRIAGAATAALLLSTLPVLAAGTTIACVFGSKEAPADLIAVCSEVIDGASTATADRAAALVVRADARGNAGQVGDAMADLDRAIMLDGSNARAFRVRAQLLRQSNGNLDRALSDLDQAVRLSPQDAGSFEERGVVLTRLGRYDRAISDYNEAIRLDPKYAQAYSDRGAAYYFSRDYTRAIADYDEAIRLDPGRARTFTNRGAAWKKLGKTDRALADESEAIRLDPTVPEYFDNRGLSYADLNQYDKAIADYDEAIRLRPRANFLTNRGDSYQFKGDLEHALADYDAALRLDPRFILAYNNRAVLFRKMGDRVKALADYEAALKLDPQFENALAGRKSLALEIEKIGAHMPLQASAKSGPSFDCTTAKRAVEKVICADPQLGTLDRDIADTYGRLVKATSGKPADALREQQRSFIADRNARFGQPDYDLRANMQKRLDALKAAQPK